MRGEKLRDVERLGKLFDVEDDVVFDNGCEVREGGRIAEDFQQVFDALAGVGEEERIVVELFAEAEELVEGSRDGERVGGGDGAEVIKNEVDDGFRRAGVDLKRCR